MVDRTVPRSLHAVGPPALARVAFVLVNPSHPGNVGAAARAMKTMGLTDLRLVAPRHPDVLERPDALALASGARDLLAAARVFPGLAPAIADAVLAVAVSAEPREFGPAPLPPEHCAARAFDALARDPAHRVAFVFGAERTGLSIDQVQACSLLASIPADPDYSSLNLAQALQIVAYCVRRAALEPQAPPPSEDDDREPLAEQQAVQGLLAHLERVLALIGFLDPAHPKKLMPRLRRLLLRSRLRVEEVDLLRGVCTRIERHRNGP